MIAAPGLEPRSVETPVSTIDINATLADLVGIDLSEIEPWTDGESLLPLARGGTREAPVYMEYAAEGTQAPLVTIREGKWKFNHCEIDPPQLFDLETDPHETCNLAEDPDYAEFLAELEKEPEPAPTTEQLIAAREAEEKAKEEIVTPLVAFMRKKRDEKERRKKARPIAPPASARPPQSHACC